MSNILLVNTVVTVLIVVSWIGLVWRIRRLGFGLVRGSRRIDLASPLRLARRLVQFGIGAGLLAWVTWSLSQTYRIETAVLPRTSGWLTTTASPLVLGASAMTAPRMPDSSMVPTEGISESEGFAAVSRSDRPVARGRTQ